MGSRKSDKSSMKENVGNKTEKSRMKGNVEKEFNKTEKSIMKESIGKESKKSISESVSDVVVNEDRKYSFYKRLRMNMLFNKGLIKISTLKEDLHSSFTEKEIDALIKQLSDEDKIFISEETIYEI